MPALDPAPTRKVHALRADITTLAVDAIVNAANSSLLGGGGVDARFIVRPDPSCCTSADYSTGAKRATRR